MTADIIRIIGGECLDDRVGAKQSIEILIEKNPDILLVVNAQKSPAENKIRQMEENVALQNVNAVRNKHFLIIDHNAFYGGSERTIDALERLQDQMIEYLDRVSE